MSFSRYSNILPSFNFSVGGKVRHLHFHTAYCLVHHASIFTARCFAQADEDTDSFLKALLYKILSDLNKHQQDSSN